MAHIDTHKLGTPTDAAHATDEGSTALLLPLVRLLARAAARDYVEGSLPSADSPTPCSQGTPND